MKTILKFALFLVFTTFMGACVSKTHIANVKEKTIKRSWVRRLTPTSELSSNEFSQSSPPVVLEDGNIIQGTNFGGISEFSFYGRKVWSLEEEIANISGKQSAYKNFLFFGTEDKKLHCFDREARKILWSVELQAAISAISDFDNGIIFALTTKGQIYAVNAADGSIKWTKYIPGEKA